MSSIAKNDVFVPVSAEKKYPEGAVEVISVSDAVVEYCSLGGGWIRKSSLTEFMTAFRFVPEEEKKQAPYKAGLFVIDDYFDPPLEGYTLGYRWNGWATPVFEKSQVFRMREVFNDITYDADTDTFTCDHGETVDDDCRYEQASGFDIYVNGEVKHVYGLGNGGWCWDDVTESS